MGKLPFSKKLKNIGTRHRILKSFGTTTAVMGSVGQKCFSIFCVVFIVMGLFLSIKTIKENKVMRKYLNISESTTTNILTLSEKGSGTLWSGYDPTGGDIGIDLKDINMSIASIAITYGTLDTKQLEYLTDYLRSAQQAGNANASVPPWLIVGLNSAFKDEIPVSSGLYIPHPGLREADWNTEINGTLADFHTQTTNSIEEKEKGYTDNTIYTGQQGILKELYNQHIQIKGTTADEYNLYNSAYTSAKLLSDNFKSLNDIMTWYEVSRDVSSKEPEGMKTFNDWSDENMWLFSAFMLNEGNPTDIFESIPVDQLDTFGKQLETIMKDREFFDAYIAEVYGKSTYDEENLKLSLGKNLVVEYFVNSLGWKITENTINKKELNKMAFKDESIMSSDPTVYPASKVGESIEQWGKRNTTYGLSGSTGVPGNHFLDNTISYTDKDGKIMMTLNIDSTLRFIRTAYMGKYYSGVGQFVVNQENVRLRKKSTGNGFKLSVVPGQDTGVMYYRDYKRWKDAGDSVIAEERLKFSVDAFQNGKVPKELYESLNFETAQKIGVDYFGSMHEAGWKSNFPLFRQGTDEIKSKPFWDSNMGGAGCSLYSFVSMAHGLGLGREPIPKEAGSKNNGLNSNGMLDPELVLQIYHEKGLNVTIDEADVRDNFGYEIVSYPFTWKVGNDMYESMWNELKGGIPFTITATHFAVEGKTYWGTDISNSSKSFTGGGHYIVLINGSVVNGVRYVEVADCNGGNSTRDNNFAWYNFDKMKETGLFRNAAYTIINNKGAGDYIIDLSRQVIQNDKIVLTDDNLVVQVVEKDGEQHIRIFKDAPVFLDITGIALSSDINTTTAKVYEKGTVVGTGTPKMRKGVINSSGGIQEPIFTELESGQAVISAPVNP